MRKNKHLNYGLDIQREKEGQSDKDYVFGSASQACLALIPQGERRLYLPQGELQNIGQEKSDCASRAPINVLETKFNYLLMNNKLSVENTKWLNEKGYITENGFEASDAYIAIKSETTRTGNSLKNPLRAIENWGLVPKSKLPQLNTWEEYHSPTRITKEIENLGLEFRKRFPIEYEKVYEEDYINLIMKDMLIVGGYAWPEEKNGEYPRTDRNPNHAFMDFEPLFYAFDNYIDSDGDFVKKLARDYKFLSYGYRAYIVADQIPKKSLFDLILEWIKVYFMEIWS